MPPELAVSPAAPGTRHAHLRLVGARRLRIADVAMFYGDHSGGIRTYLDAKARHAALTEAFEHHMLIPGREERHEAGRHELPSMRIAGTAGYRVPLGGGALQRTLEDLAPDVVLLHDPFWRPAAVARIARPIGARLLTVHHGSSALKAAALPGPSRLYEPFLRLCLRRAAAHTDAILSNVDVLRDCGRAATLPLRLGVDDAFRPRPELDRGDEVLYVGRLSREKEPGLVLEAAARSAEPWPLRFVGSGPLEARLRARAAQLGIAHRVAFHPHVRDPEILAHVYARASCVVLPGRHETFGLVALEAAACGARVVVCQSTPSARVIGDLGHPVAPGDARALLCAIEEARGAPRDPAAAAALSMQHRWSWALTAELDAIRELLR